MSGGGFSEHSIGQFRYSLFMDEKLFFIPLIMELLKLKRRDTSLFVNLGLSGLTGYLASILKLIC